MIYKEFFDRAIPRDSDRLKITGGTGLFKPSPKVVSVPRSPAISLIYQAKITVVIHSCLGSKITRENMHVARNPTRVQACSKMYLPAGKTRCAQGDFG
ncbi:protein of unknown function [Methylocaldum szegediense]|jgi:hypothetical protein|uniref:Uncharacterized protein n=1 Tax=Methylocaldum szegediense TaxID=73780 RepID=A0ABN8X3N2_9GAMM|nr:protein of unknown function [Methylocaldum szegediense]